MAAALDRDTRLADTAERAHIDLCGTKKRIAQGLAQFRIKFAQILFVDVKNLAHQGEAVGMNAGGSNADQDIAGTDLRTGDQVLFVCSTHCEACQIILVHRIKTGHFRCLAADQGSSRLLAAVTDTLDDLRDLLGDILAAGNIVKEKERLAARACHVIDTHGDTIDTDRIMPVHQESKFELCSDAVSSGQQDRIFHLFDLCQREGARKSAESSHYFRTHGLCDIRLHQFYTAISGFDINAGTLIIHHVMRVSLCSLW